MPSIEYPKTTKYVITHNNNDVFHYNIVESQHCFASGQPYMEVFDSEEEAKQAFPQLFPTLENTSLSSNFVPILDK